MAGAGAGAGVGQLRPEPEPEPEPELAKKHSISQMSDISDFFTSYLSCECEYKGLKTNR